MECFGRSSLPKPCGLLLVPGLPLTCAHSPRTLLGGATTTNLALSTPVSGRESAVTWPTAPGRWDPDCVLDEDDWQHGLWRHGAHAGGVVGAVWGIYQEGGCTTPRLPWIDGAGMGQRLYRVGRVVAWPGFAKPACGQRHLRLPFSSSRDRCYPVGPVAADRWKKGCLRIFVHPPWLPRLLQDVYRHARPIPTRYRFYLPPVVPNVQGARPRWPRGSCARLDSYSSAVHRLLWRNAQRWGRYAETARQVVARNALWFTLSGWKEHASDFNNDGSILRDARHPLCDDTNTPGAELGRLAHLPRGAAADDERVRSGVALGASARKVRPTLWQCAHLLGWSGRMHCGGGCLPSAAASQQPEFPTNRGAVQWAFELVKDDASRLPGGARRPTPRSGDCCLDGKKHRHALWALSYGSRPKHAGAGWPGRAVERGLRAVANGARVEHRSVGEWNTPRPVYCRRCIMIQRQGHGAADKRSTPGRRPTSDCVNQASREVPNGRVVLSGVSPLTQNERRHSR